jgi:hypothetical protein
MVYDRRLAPKRAFMRGPWRSTKTRKEEKGSVCAHDILSRELVTTDEGQKGSERGCLVAFISSVRRVSRLASCASRCANRGLRCACTGDSHPRFRVQRFPARARRLRQRISGTSPRYVTGYGTKAHLFPARVPCQCSRVRAAPLTQRRPFTASIRVVEQNNTLDIAAGIQNANLA